MDRPMRRNDRLITDQQARKILENGEYGVLSMSTPDGGAYGVPLNFALWNDAIYFHSAIEGAKLEFLGEHDRVSFCVVGSTELLPAEFGTRYESTIVFGTASEVTGEEKRLGLEKLVEKYSGGYRVEGSAYIEKYFERTRVVKITISSMTGKAGR